MRNLYNKIQTVDENDEAPEESRIVNKDNGYKKVVVEQKEKKDNELIFDGSDKLVGLATVKT